MNDERRAKVPPRRTEHVREPRADSHEERGEGVVRDVACTGGKELHAVILDALGR